MEETENKDHIKVRDEVLSIQNYAIHIASKGILHKFQVRKKNVDNFTLDYLSAYFTTPVKVDGNGNRYIIIVADNCNITIFQEPKKS